MIKTLSIDLETYSDVDIAKCGVYKYAASPRKICMSCTERH